MKATQCVTGVLTIAMTATLAACGGDGGVPPAAFCSPIGGGGATATRTSCSVNCNQQDIEASVDARFDTWATLGLSVQSEGVLRGTAQEGAVFPAGGYAGVYLHKPPLATGTFQVTLTTYLDGIVVDSDIAYEEDGGGGRFCNFSCLPHGDNLFLGIPAEAPFDAIEIAYNQSGGTQSREVRLYEFCIRDG